MATGGNGEKQTRTLLDSNFVKKSKFDEEQDENDWGSDWQDAFCVLGAFPYSLGTPATISPLDNPAYYADCTQVTLFHNTFNLEFLFW